MIVHSISATSFLEPQAAAGLATACGGPRSDQSSGDSGLGFSGVGLGA